MDTGKQWDRDTPGSMAKHVKRLVLDTHGRWCANRVHSRKNRATQHERVYHVKASHVNDVMTALPVVSFAARRGFLYCMRRTHLTPLRFSQGRHITANIWRLQKGPYLLHPLRPHWITSSGSPRLQTVEAHHLRSKSALKRVMNQALNICQERNA